MNTQMRLNLGIANHLFVFGLSLLLFACNPQGTETLSTPTSSPLVTSLVSWNGIVEGKQAPVRENPDFEARVVVVLSQGDSVEVLAVTLDENWYLVNTESDIQGWIVADFIALPQAEDITGYPAPSESQTQVIEPAYPTPSSTPLRMPTSTLLPLNGPTETPCVGYDCFFPPPFSSFYEQFIPIVWLGLGLTIGWFLVVLDWPPLLSKRRKD